MAEASDAPLTEDTAVAAILAMDDPTAGGEQPAPEAEAEEIIADGDEAEVEIDPDAEVEVDPEADPEPPTAVKVEAPQWWDAEAKAAFEAIPNTPAAREYAQKIQQYVVEAEAKREAITARAKDTERAAAAQLQTMKAVTERLEKAQPAAVEQFERDYGDINWSLMPAWAKANPAAATEFFAEFNARKAAVEEQVRVTAEAAKLATDTFAHEQSARLAEIAPTLAQSHESLVALGEYALKTGLPAEALNRATAEELNILNKARLWDAAQAKAKAAAGATTPRTSAPPPKTVKPVAAQVSGTHAQRTYAQAKDRVMKSRSDDDAVAAILAGGF